MSWPKAKSRFLKSLQQLLQKLIENGKIITVPTLPLPLMLTASGEVEATDEAFAFEAANQTRIVCAMQADTQEAMFGYRSAMDCMLHWLVNRGYIEAVGDPVDEAMETVPLMWCVGESLDIAAANQSLDME